MTSGKRRVACNRAHQGWILEKGGCGDHVRRERARPECDSHFSRLQIVGRVMQRTRCEEKHAVFEGDARATGRSKRDENSKRNRSWVKNVRSGWTFTWLLCFYLRLSVPGSSGAAAVHLQQVGHGGNCLGEPWVSPRPCRILSSQDIPVMTVGLYSSDGEPCCGSASTTVEVTFLPSNAPAVQIPLTGFTVKDSTISYEPAAAMTLDFSGLKTTNAVAGMFNLTFSAFFDGVPLQYQATIQIIPDSMQLRSAAGWIYAIHQVLPTLYLDMVGKNTTIAAGSGQRIHVRLFNKGDMSDISEYSLRGTTSALVGAGGTAIFTDLSAQRTAGSGFHLAFFVGGSEKRCVQGMASITCSDVESRRGKAGGLGGYWSEIAGPAMTLLPDKITLETQFMSLETTVSVDKSLPVYTLAMYDSRYPGERLGGITSDDNFEASVSLITRSERYPVKGSHLKGTKTVIIQKGAANFKDLVVRNMTGPSFGLLFTTSWNAFCESANLDPACSGRCCIHSPDFAIFPYAMRLAPVTLQDMVAGDNIT